MVGHQRKRKRETLIQRPLSSQMRRKSRPSQFDAMGQQETKMPVVLLCEADNDGSDCKGWAGVLSHAREIFRFRRRIRLGRTLQYLYIDRAQRGEHSC